MTKKPQFKTIEEVLKANNPYPDCRPVMLGVERSGWRKLIDFVKAAK